MSDIRIGVIGGSGLYAMEGLRVIEERRIDTPFGEPSDAYIIGELEGRHIAFLPRHGRGHRLLPTELNYRANIFGLKMLGVEQVISRRLGHLSEGCRATVALASVIGGLPGFNSAQQIHAELRRRGERVGLTTVYRHLQVLSEDGQVDAIRDANGETLYRRCESNAHHHHLTCRSCGTSVEVEGRAVERWADRVAAEAGFTAVDHTVELFGLCPACSQATG